MRISRPTVTLALTLPLVLAGGTGPFASHGGDDGPARPVAGPLRFDFGPGPAASGYTAVTPSALYDEARGWGFLPGADLSAVSSPDPTDPLRGDAITADAPFYFSAAVPEGNYRVTVTLGHPEQATAGTVKAESRRLMLESVETAPGEPVTRSFTSEILSPCL